MLVGGAGPATLADVHADIETGGLKASFSTFDRFDNDVHCARRVRVFGNFSRASYGGKVQPAESRIYNG